MNAIRVWSIVTIVAMVAIVVVGWFLGIAPRLADARTAADERAMVEVLNASQQSRLAQLERLNDDKPALERQLAELRRELPEGAALPELLGQLSVIAGGTGTQLVGFTASEPSEFVAEAAEPTPAATDAAAPATGTAAPTAAPATGAAGFLSIPVNVQVNGTQAQLAEFVRQLQYGDRLFLVTSMTTAVEDPAGAAASASIDGLVYVMLGANAGVTAASSPAS